MYCSCAFLRHTQGLEEGRPPATKSKGKVRTTLDVVLAAGYVPFGEGVPAPSAPPAPSSHAADGPAPSSSVPSVGRKGGLTPEEELEKAKGWIDADLMAQGPVTSFFFLSCYCWCMCLLFDCCGYFLQQFVAVIMFRYYYLL